ncbi:TPA: hypothetical protein U2N26_003035, partial [Acinetobacter nosocomialis]
MTIQTINLGSAPTGAGGDTFRSTGAKINENFTNSDHAASRNVGVQPGNVMEVGAFGIGGQVSHSDQRYWIGNGFKGFDPSKNGLPFAGQGISIGWEQAVTEIVCLAGIPVNRMFFRTGNNQSAVWAEVRHTGNTTIDSNGFLKSASPVVKLFADKIQPNDEAAEQQLSFEKLGIGHYLIKGSSGFAKEGWWIEIPTDTHGNKICAVEYQTLENGDLEIKTFKKTLNDEGDIVANFDAPIDIPNNVNDEPRWIDIRLNTVKKTIVRKVPRTEKQPRMVQQVKYAPQLTYITKYEDLFDDEGKAVIVDGKNYKKPVT